MDYFSNCQSVEEAKKLYKKLLMQYRPNNCGDSMSRTTVSNVTWASANKIHCSKESQLRRPDHAGEEGENITKEIIGQFNGFLNGFMSQSFNSYYEDKEWKPNAEAVTPFQEVLQKIINLDCEIEIIGYWIYCFNSKEVREQLKELGFWFSGKHKAWIYSGRPKRLRAGKETLDEIRAKKGSQKIEREEKEEKAKYPLKAVI
jgi:hypothetical protein